jgi:hypothetical protein
MSKKKTPMNVEYGALMSPCAWGLSCNVGDGGMSLFGMAERELGEGMSDACMLMGKLGEWMAKNWSGASCTNPQLSDLVCVGLEIGLEMMCVM